MESRLEKFFSMGINITSLAVWLGEDRKCSAAVVGLDLLLGLPMIPRCSLNGSFNRAVVSSLLCIVDYSGCIESCTYTFFSTGETRPIKFNLTCKTKNLIYKIQTGGRAGYELIYITNEAVGRVGYYPLISGKSEKNNCFSKFASNSLGFFG